jgi:hypothetical protein
MESPCFRKVASFSNTTSKSGRIRIFSLVTNTGDCLRSLSEIFSSKRTLFCKTRPVLGVCAVPKLWQSKPQQNALACAKVCVENGRAGFKGVSIAVTGVCRMDYP